MEEQGQNLEAKYGSTIYNEAKSLLLRSDILFRYVMHKDKEALEDFVEIYLGRKIKFNKTDVQAFKPSLKSRSSIYDVLAESDDEIVIIELQNRIKGDENDRFRYYHAISDADAILRGHPFSELKDLTVLALVGGDILGDGKIKYTNRMYVEETGKCNPYLRVTYVYINMDMCEGDSPIAKANHDLSCDKVEDMYYPLFARLYAKGQSQQRCS